MIAVIYINKVQSICFAKNYYSRNSNREASTVVYVFIIRNSYDKGETGFDVFEVLFYKCQCCIFID